MRKRLIGWLVLWLLLLPAQPVWAVAGEQAEPARLAPITVMAPQPGVEISTDRTIIYLDEFRKPGFTRSLEDVLRELGGIDVLRHNGLMASPGDEIAIRGLSEGRLVVEIDGRRINHTGHFGRYVVDWSTLNIDDIERVEIIRGSHSVLHPFAIGGVINIITRKGKKTDQWKPDFAVGGGYSSFNTYYTKGSVDGGFLNLVGYHLSASRQGTDGYLRNNFQWNNSFAGGLRLFLPYDATIWLGARYTKVNYGFPVVNDPARPDFDPDYPPFLASADMLRHLPTSIQLPGGPTPQWFKNTYYLDGIFTVPLWSGTFKVHAYTTDGRRDLYYYTSPTNFSSIRTRDVTRGLLAEYRDFKLWSGDFLQSYLTLGVDYQELGWPPNNPMIYVVRSAYLQDVLRLGQRVTFTAGVRYYNISMDTYYAWFEVGRPAPTFPVEGKQQRESGYYPSFKLEVQATPTTALYAAVSRGLRLPCP